MASYTPEQKAEALWMLDNGWPSREVEDRIGCSNASLYSWGKLRDGGELELPPYEPAVDLRLALRRRQQESGELTDTAPAEPPAEPPVQQTLGDDGDKPSHSMEPTPLPVPVPVPNGGSVEPADVLSMSALVAELGEWRGQLDEAVRRASRAEAALAERDVTIAQLRREIDGLRQQQSAADEVAAEALAAERARSANFRGTMAYLLEREQ